MRVETHLAPGLAGKGGREDADKGCWDVEGGDDELQDVVVVLAIGIPGARLEDLLVEVDIWEELGLEVTHADHTPDHPCAGSW